MIAVLAADQPVGFFVADDLFRVGIEGKRATKSRSDIAEMAEGCRKVSRERVGTQFCTVADRGDEVADVGGIVLGLHRYGQLSGFVLRVEDLEFAAATEEHLTARPVKFRAAIHVVRIVRTPQPLFVDQQPPLTSLARLLIGRRVLGLADWNRDLARSPYLPTGSLSSYVHPRDP